MALIGEAHRRSSLRGGMPGAKQRRGLFDANVSLECMGRKSDGALELTQEVEAAQTTHARELREADVFRDVRTQIVHRPRDAPRNAGG